MANDKCNMENGKSLPCYLRGLFEHLDTELRPSGFLAALDVGCGSARVDALLRSGRAQEAGLVFGDVRDVDGGNSGARSLPDAGANGRRRGRERGDLRDIE